MKPNRLAQELAAFSKIAPDLKRRMLRDAVAKVKEAARLRFNFAAALGAVAELRIDVERLRAERDAALADAARYRWLRDVGDWSWVPLVKRCDMSGIELDAAIDAALREGEK